MEDIPLSESTEGMLGLPESQTELDVIHSISYKRYVSFLKASILFQNLTEYNTAHNRRITMTIGISDDTSAFKKVVEI